MTQSGTQRVPEDFDYLSRRGQSAQITSKKGDVEQTRSESIPPEATLLAASGGRCQKTRRWILSTAYLSTWAIYDNFPFEPEAGICETIVAQNSTQADPGGSNLINVLQTHYTGDRQFKRELNLAMSAAFGDEFEELIFPPASDKESSSGSAGEA